MKRGGLMNRMMGRCLAVSAILLLVAGTSLAAQDVASDVAWLIEVLELEEGSTVADIGAGRGELTIALSPALGPGGRIFATELGSESVDGLAQATASAGAVNVTVLEGHPSRTNLPEGCCDALDVRFVYHHFADPPAMNASLLESLRPGGRLAVIDFSPRGDESADPAGRAEGDQHGITADTLAGELARAGFTVVSVEQGSDRLVRVLALKES